MFESIGSFFNAVKNASFDLGAFGNFARDLYYSITENSDISSIWTAIMNILSPIYFIIPYILIALLLVTAFFGKKIIGLIKFVAFFIVGFALGVYFIHPLISGVLPMPGWISGLVVGILAAALYRFIYIVLYAVSWVYVVYVLCYKSFVPADALEFMLDKALIALIIAVLVTILAFIFKKFIEMLGTSALSGYLIAVTVKNLIFDYTTLEFLSGLGWLATLVITLVVTVPSFIVQIKTRRRY